MAITAIPKPGTQVHLVLREFSAYRYAKPTRVLDATVIDKFWWERDRGVFCVMVPFDEVPTRSIRMDHVVSINGEVVSGWDEPNGPQIQEWAVESSSGPDFYRVTFDGQNWRCGCRGFSFHRHCRHIDQIQGKLHETSTVQI